jgi:hypothetical protein
VDRNQPGDGWTETERSADSAVQDRPLGGTVPPGQRTLPDACGAHQPTTLALGTVVTIESWGPARAGPGVRLWASR